MVCKTLKITLLPVLLSVSSVSPLVIQSFRLIFFYYNENILGNKLCSSQAVTTSLVTQPRTTLGIEQFLTRREGAGNTIYHSIYHSKAGGEWGYAMGTAVRPGNCLNVWYLWGEDK